MSLLIKVNLYTFSLSSLPLCGRPFCEVSLILTGPELFRTDDFLFVSTLTIDSLAKEYLYLIGMFYLSEVGSCSVTFLPKIIIRVLKDFRSTCGVS